MKQIVQKSGDRQKAVTARRAAHRKKVVIALALFFITAILWIRVFIDKGGPKTASATLDANAAETAAEPAVMKVIYTDLPMIAHRHDVLANDIFAAGDFKGFRKQGEFVLDSDVDISGALNRRLSDGLAAAVDKLELIAIVHDKKPQAFIGDELLEKNQSFKFTFGGRVYNFRVVNILEDRVELECDGAIVTKKIPGILLPSIDSGQNRTE